MGAATTTQVGELLAQAQALLDTGTDDRSAVSVFADVVPAGTMLYASRDQRGRWWYYLVMPEGWRPDEDAPGARRWLVNPNSGRRWDTGWVGRENEEHDSKAGALLAGLQRLVGAL